MTALLVPFCSFSTVVSLDNASQAEQESAVKELSIGKMIHYPSVVEQLYQSTNYRLNWQNERDVEQFIFQLNIVALADVTEEFDDQLHRINQTKWQGDNLDFDLVMTDSLLMYLSYLEQLPHEGVNWLFANKAQVDLPPPSIDTLSVLSNELTVGKLDQVFIKFAFSTANGSRFQLGFFNAI